MRKKIAAAAFVLAALAGIAAPVAATAGSSAPVAGAPATWYHG